MDAAKITLIDLLTNAEKKHIEILKEKMNSSRTLLGIFINWRKIKKIIKFAEERTFYGVVPRRKLVISGDIIKYAHNRANALME